MSASVRISRKTALVLLDYLDGAPRAIGSVAIAQLRAALRPSPKKTLARKEKRARVAGKRATKKEETAAIYEKVARRANGDCECGCGFAAPTHSYSRGPEMDHEAGRGRARQSERNCWMLTRVCHREKHAGFPSRAFWLQKFAAHCDKFGFRPEAREARAEMDAGADIEAAARISAGVANV